MFRVSYVSGKFEDRRHKDFSSEIVDRIELERESDGPAPEEVSE